jgi:hypothetical protein
MGEPVFPSLRAKRRNPLYFVIAGLDPAIHFLRKMFAKKDGCAGQARA